MVSDEQITALRAGDEAAWVGFAREMRRRLLARTVQAVGESEADDLLQEVFIRIFSHRDEIRDAEHLERFVWRVWHQRVVDCYRRQNTRGRAVSLSETGKSSPTQDALPPDELCDPKAEADPIRRVVFDEVRGVLDRSVLLRSEQKLIVRHKIFDDLSFQEIASILQQNSASVQTRYYTALESLRLEFALHAYRDHPDGFDGELSDQQRAALGHLIAGLDIKKTARLQRMKVPELNALLAPVLKTLSQTATAHWLDG